jgi:TolB-like protein
MKRSLRSSILGFLLLVALAGALLYLIMSRGPKQAGTEPNVHSLAVLPFRPLSAESRDEYLGLGMAETLITRLSHLQQLLVRPTRAVLKYADVRQDPIAVGRELGVDLVLDGSFQKLDDRLRVTVRLVNVGDGAALWADKFDTQFTDIFQVQDTISEQVAAALVLELTSEERRLLTKRGTTNSDAYQLYLQGRYLWNKRTEEGFRKAIEYYQRAIALDPNYALAYTGLADAYHLLGDYSYLSPKEAFPQAAAAAQKALERDETLAEAHTALAYAKFLYEWDWPGAEASFKRALDLNPRYPTAHQWYAEYHVAMGRFDEALDRIRRAQALDPTSPVLGAVAGWVFYMAGRYDQAIEQCRQTLALEPNFYPAHFWIGQALEKKGLYREAIAAYEQALALAGDSPEVSASLGHALALAGDRAKAREMLRQLQEHSAREYVAAYFVALIYAGLDQTDQTLTWLERAYEERARAVPFWRVDPMLDRLRSDSRFADLLQRVHLQ